MASRDGRGTPGWMGARRMEIISDYQLIITADDERLRQEILAIVAAHNLPLVTIKNVGASLEEIFHKLTIEEGDTKL